MSNRQTKNNLAPLSEHPTPPGPLCAPLRPSLCTTSHRGIQSPSSASAYAFSWRSSASISISECASAKAGTGSSSASGFIVFVSLAMVAYARIRSSRNVAQRRSSISRSCLSRSARMATTATTTAAAGPARPSNTADGPVIPNVPAAAPAGLDCPGGSPPCPLLLAWPSRTSLPCSEPTVKNAATNNSTTARITIMPRRDRVTLRTPASTRGASVRPLELLL